MHDRGSLGALALILLTPPAAARPDGAGQLDYPANFFAAFHPNNALDMVQRVPGFTFVPGDPTLRGMAEAAGNVVIDGKRVTDKNFTFDQVLQRIPADQVDHITLLRGGASGIDMLGQPIVANVVRKAAASASAAITVASGINADGRATPALTLERTRNSGQGRLVSVSASVSRYADRKLGDGSRRRTNGADDPSEFATVDARAGGTTGFAQGTVELPGLGGQLRLNSTLTWTSYHEKQADRVYSPRYSVSTIDADLGGFAHGQAGAEIGGHLDRKFGAALGSETSALLRLGRKSYRSLLDAPGADTRFSEHDRTREALIRSRLCYTVNNSVSVAVSVEGAHNKLATRSAFSFNDVPVALPNGKADVTEKRGEIGVEATWQPSRALNAEGGVRLEYSQINAIADTVRRRRDSFVKPFVRLALAPTARQQLRMRVAREAGQLDFANFIAGASLDRGSVSSGNAAIRPNNAWIAELAYEWRSGGAAATLTVRHSWLHDVIDRIPIISGDVLFDAPGNIGSGREGDVVGNLTLPLAFLGLPQAELKLDGTWRHARVTDPTTGKSRGISNQKPVEFAASFHQDLPRWKAAWGAKFDAGWTTHNYLFNEVDINRAGLLLTLFTDYVPRAGLSFHLEMSEATGRRYRRGITFYDGLRGAGPLAYRDDRRLRVGQTLLLSLRRAF
ncbi:TonB-dependent receptor plug domain-containing protein [Sphingomonas crusticola]|uniref:TonB-dependent receptor plug domain-containing protein n=1 Tax=Sphingomonas crusticola TaxID=1697973 RepID=UPI000E258FF2|nr:TonB-dependent receptor [Sphingomonas crusticola]